MDYKERIILSHMKALSNHYGEELNKMKFNKPRIYDNQNDSVVSISDTKKTAFVTRHLLTDDVTHVLLLDGEWFNRL